MLHFHPRYSSDVSDTPFAAELSRLGVPHRFFASGINLRYTTVFGLLFSVYPRLAWLALRSAVRSLLLSRPRPGAAVVGYDIEAVVFGCVRALFRLPTKIVFETLIITPRTSPVVNVVYMGCYKLLLSLVDIGICHSRAEVARYSAAFPNARCRFVYVPFGTTVTGREALMAAYRASHRDAAIVTAGRSGRDYQTLAEAIRGLPCRLHIICDIAPPLAHIAASEQITVVRGCFGDAYIEALANALFVVVPLSVDDISAGQMVLLQASAVGKAVIITQTATTAEYATDGEDAVFVTRGDVQQMRRAIQRLLDDPAARQRLGDNAARRFERDYSTEAYVRHLVHAIDAASTERRTPH